MEQDNELQRLEQFVENLLTRFSELRTEKANLLRDVRERDEIISGLRENVSSKDVERTEISLRVNKIVEQIEEWEQNLDDSEFDDASSVSETSDIEAADDSEAFSMGESETGEDSDDEDGKGQQNLFS